MSPRNSPEALVAMLEKSSCHRVIITHASLGPLLSDVRSLLPADFALAVEEVPTLAQCYPNLGHEPANSAIEYPASSESHTLDDLAFYLHSSGSTGFPKPVPHTTRTALGWVRMEIVSDFRGIRIAAMMLPPFHTMGVLVHFLTNMASVCSAALYPPVSFEDHTKPLMIPTSDNLIEHAKRTQSTAVIVVPSFLEAWVSQPDIVEWLKTMRVVGSGGGPLGLTVGDALAKAGVQIRSMYGGTEIGVPVCLFGDAEERKIRALEDWNYTCFSKLVNVRWAPQTDNTFECQILDTDFFKVAIENLPDVKGYATSDLWTPHPTKPGFWRIVGRLDDVIILASGENMVPGPLESIIVSSPLIGGAVIFGRGRSQVGVLLEPFQGVVVGDLAEFRNRIWPVIEEANKTAPAFSRIYKEMILVTSEDKPMPRVAKGTVSKKPTLTLYQTEIDVLYDKVEASAQAVVNVDPPTTWSAGDIQTWLEAQTTDVSSGRTITTDGDLFEQGFDSLSATFLRNRIASALRNSSDPDVTKAAGGISQNFIFAHPSIRDLAFQISDLVTGGSSASTHSAVAAIESMIEKYSAGLRERVVAHSTPTLTCAVVLLTGSTGALGSYLLESLLNDPRVKKVYAYNRPGRSTATIQARQRDAFADKGFDVDLLTSPKLAYLEGDSARPQLGLSDGLYAEVRASVTTIIHNAWRLDFNLSLASFEPHVRGTRSLIDIALSSAHAVRFMFTSSVASAQGWDLARGPFPEAVQLDAGVAVGGGYGEGKYVAERILANSGLQAASFRIGQICGGLPSGAWSTTDWVPSLVKSSVALGALPDAHGVISWLPMQAVSQTILDVAFAPDAPPIALNIVHPRPVAWSAIMRPLSEALHQHKVTPDVIPLVAFKEWFAMLENSATGADEHDMGRIPALKLLEFFRRLSAAPMEAESSHELGGSAAFATVKSEAASSAMRGLARLSAVDAKRWIKYWNAMGIFA
ncbi:putative nonribosomal peptide synthetase [Athelia psychrophila]|uniref:Nonribosomal peptide synthetase n=1 Tax=Athelia psychrophila TaxID=1759441 RepID=A0A166VU63_9AGAM|nr:putative nonribosomal peptide synthetase [Fibularhizoctonia sp. CBS 109695]